MKILHLIDSFDARFERDQIKLVELLERKGYRNTVITSRFSSDWKHRRKAEFKLWEKNFSQTEILHEPSFRIPTPFSREPSTIYLPLRRILHDFDIIHAYTFGTYSSLLGAILKKVKKSKLVIRSDLSASAYYKTKNKALYRTITMYPFRVTDAVYAYSMLEKRYLVDLGIQKSKIWVIPPGIDFDKFSKSSIVPKRDITTIGYLGRFCFVKGVHRIIPVLHDLLRREEKVRVFFTGIIEDGKYAEDVLKQLKQFRNFQFLADLSLSPLRFYDMCDIILVPSVSETGAITVLEVMASGKTVIASDINPINEYIQHEFNGFLFQNQEELYFYLKNLIENPDLIVKIGKNARESAKKYDWKIIMRRYEEMYKSVIKGEK
ncbi:MAG: glycosyltransferase family 4 protein [Candidatus Bathyarchaeia archaeon]